MRKIAKVYGSIGAERGSMMRLKAVVLRNFRCYRDEVRIEIADGITGLIGRNDAGKSSVLEALDIFFENSKVEPADACVHGDCDDVLIGCVFDDLPERLVIDADRPTTLANEYLLNAEGDLEIHKIFRCSSKTPQCTVYAVAQHPIADGVADLLELNITDLKKRLDDAGVSANGVDKRVKSAIRQAIWMARGDALQLDVCRIPLAKEDAKAIWDQLVRYLPTFALFRADRPSRDEDAEVQDPMKAAVAQAIRAVEGELAAITDRVKQEATRTAEATLQKLQEMAPDIAAELSPRFDDPKWASLFKLSLDSDYGIPINKRGSGVRRLILLNFFRAEAERRQAEEGAPGIIYAIEEPETSQHPRNQRLLIRALLELSERPDCQVIITTHVPGLAGMLPVDSIRFVTLDANGNAGLCDEVGMLKTVAEELGVIPDSRIKVLLFVEGPNDIEFLSRVCAILRSDGADLVDISSDPAVACVPLGGQTLVQWVHNNYLEELERPQVYVLDGDCEAYDEACEHVNAWGGGCRAFRAKRREMENYLHPDAIRAVFGVEIKIDDNTDVPVEVARRVHEQSDSQVPWDSLSDEKKSKKESRIKQRLNSEAAKKMTPAQLKETDPDGEILSWLTYVTELARAD